MKSLCNGNFFVLFVQIFIVGVGQNRGLDYRPQFRPLDSSQSVGEVTVKLMDFRFKEKLNMPLTCQLFRIMHRHCIIVKKYQNMHVYWLYVCIYFAKYSPFANDCIIPIICTLKGFSHWRGDVTVTSLSTSTRRYQSVESEEASCSLWGRRAEHNISFLDVLVLADNLVIVVWGGAKLILLYSNQ